MIPKPMMRPTTLKVKPAMTKPNSMRKPDKSKSRRGPIRSSMIPAGTINKANKIKIGRASCRERVKMAVGGEQLKEQNEGIWRTELGTNTSETRIENYE